MRRFMFGLFAVLVMVFGLGSAVSPKLDPAPAAYAGVQVHNGGPGQTITFSYGEYGESVDGYALSNPNGIERLIRNVGTIVGVLFFWDAEAGIYRADGGLTLEFFADGSYLVSLEVPMPSGTMSFPVELGTYKKK